MAPTIGDEAPNFTAQTTEGEIDFHDWMGDSWAVLFSHPKDFTPVCTTELGYMASIKPEFDKRGVKIIGLSVDPVDKHSAWADDIEETQGTRPNYPIIGDSDYAVSKAYGMLPADVSGDPAERTPALNQTVRNVFVIGPDKKIKLLLVYPMTTGRNFDEVLRVIDSLQLTANHKVATPAQWQSGDDVIIAGCSASGRSRSRTSGWCPSRASGVRRLGDGDTPGGNSRRPARTATRDPNARAGSTARQRSRGAPRDACRGTADSRALPDRAPRDRERHGRAGSLAEGARRSPRRSS